MTHNVLGLCDVGAFIERQTNQQQMPFFEKQMYNTLFVRPNIAKPMLAAVHLRPAKSCVLCQMLPV